MKNNKIVLFGPGPYFKGGISNYNTSLAKALAKFPDLQVFIVSWTQQYPAIIPRDFVDHASKVDLLEGTNIKIQYITNYNNPFSWNATYKLIKEIDPAMVVFQWAIALQGIPMGYIARKIKKNTDIEVVFDLHLVVQKEASSLDKFCTKYGLKIADTYLTHAQKTVEELKITFPDMQISVNQDGTRVSSPTRTVIKLYHPIYDIFKSDPNLDVEALKKEWGLKKHVFLYFGFIRKYKGLHWVIPAFAEVLKKRDDVSLIIAGESFWNTLDSTKFTTKLKKAVFGFAKSLVLKNKDNEQDYNPLKLIEDLGIQKNVYLQNRFIANEEVNKFFQVSDSILTFYETATPSGVESLAYNFEMPVLATKVGHFPETIKDGYNGYLANPGDIQDIANVMLKSIDFPIDRANVRETIKNLSWENYAKALINK